MQKMDKMLSKTRAWFYQKKKITLEEKATASRFQ